MGKRLAGRIQLTTDSYRPYAGAVQEAFGHDVDYAQVVKLFGAVPERSRASIAPHSASASARNAFADPARATASTSHVERNNLNVRMHQRRMTRLTNAFSKKMANHAHVMALHFLYYNFVRVHKTLRVTTATVAGVTDRPWEMSDMIGVLESWEAVRQGG